MTSDRDPRPVFGTTRFEGAQFSGDVSFERAWFGADVWFSGVEFREEARFLWAEFRGQALFDDTRFESNAWFNAAQFSAVTSFERASFGADAWFSKAQFSEAQNTLAVRFNNVQFSGRALFDEVRSSGNVWFTRAQFSGDASFELALFGMDAWFDGAQFDGPWRGTMECGRTFRAVGVTVTKPLRLQTVAFQVLLERARVEKSAVFSVRYGAVDLTDIVVEESLAVISPPSWFWSNLRGPLQESHRATDARAKVTSLAGADAAKIVLADADLSNCLFSGSYNLDKIRLEGRCLFGQTPRGWQRDRGWVAMRRWTRRKVLAEEAAWRADPNRDALARIGWTAPYVDNRLMPSPSPAQLTVLYRQLRKALEDGKDTPGASDFYYGEMEARRHDVDGTPRAERWLLHAYWLLSGYALRASRALGFLAATAAVTILLLMTVGLPDNQLDPQITSTVPSPGHQTVFTESMPDPALTIPLAQRFTVRRADQAALIVTNSVIFRSGGSTLTGPGTWIEIASRIGEPILLGFAAVAARGRIKR